MLYYFKYDRHPLTFELYSINTRGQQYATEMEYMVNPIFLTKLINILLSRRVKQICVQNG